MVADLIELNRKKKLVQAYHILAYLGLDDHTYTHLSVRANNDSFYIYQFGFRFEEVGTENLLRVSLDGEILEGKEKHYNETGYVTHAAVYRNRPDINCVFHIHTPYITAVSALREGLLPINQWALRFYNNIAYHSYNSLVLDKNYGQKIAHDLGSKMVMLMRHHGAVICGQHVEEAMFYTYHLEKACQTQAITLSMNKGYLRIPEEICQKAVNDVLSFEKNLGERDWEAWVRAIKRIK